MEAGIRIRQLREKILKRILKNGFERCDFSCAVRFGSGKRTAPAVPEDLGLGSTRLHRTIRLGLGRARLQPCRKDSNISRASAPEASPSLDNLKHRVYHCRRAALQRHRTLGGATLPALR